MITNAIGSASADVVREAGDITRRAHLDEGLNLAEGTSADGGGGSGDAGVGVGATAEGVVHDLATLVHVSWLSCPATSSERRGEIPENSRPAQAGWSGTASRSC